MTKDNLVNLNVDIAGIKMKNPVVVASGTFGYGEEYSQLMDLSQLGAIVAKSITISPKAGNAPPRIIETPAGMLNAIGLQNVGLKSFILEKMPFLRDIGIPIIVSISGEGVEEYKELSKNLNEVDGVAGLEVNISCPNVAKGGMAFGSDSSSTFSLVKAIRKSTRLPLIVKLSPNVTNIVEIARAAEEAGADALSLINTLLGMVIDVYTRKPKLGNVTGGLSGPAIRPVAVRMVWQAAKAVNLPIIGMGGIMTAVDALEFIIAGANAVSVGTANFVNPLTGLEIISGIKDFMIQNNIQNIKHLVGSLCL